MPWSPHSLSKSIVRYFALAFDDPAWTLRDRRMEVRAEDRPVLVVSVGQSQLARARETRGVQGETEETYPVTVTAYPIPDADARDSQLAAENVRKLLLDVLRIGFTVVGAAGRPFSGPLRLPLWDYSAVDPSGAGAARAGPANPHDVVFVVRESIQANALQDPEDELRWTCFLEFRCSVEAPGRDPDAGRPTLGKVGPGAFNPPPP